MKTPVLESLLAYRPKTLLKETPAHFPVNFVEFLKTPVTRNTPGRLLLRIVRSIQKSDIT